MKYRIQFMATLLAAGLTVSCNKEHEDGIDTHEPHAEKITLTSYGRVLEVYCEADPLVAGSQSQMLLHLTRLSDFKPQARARVSVTLNAGGSRLNLQADTLARPGVCAFVVLPQKAGKGVLTVNVQGADGLHEQVDIPVQVHADASSAHSTIEAQKPQAGGNTVVFSKEMSWKARFSTEECRREAFGPAFRVMAQVEPAQGEEHVVPAQVSGVVHMGSVVPVEGMEVRAGQALLSVNGGTMADGNLSVRIQEVEAAYRKAKNELERKEPLAKEQIVSQNDLQATRAEYETAKAQYESLKRFSSHGCQVVSAPIRGYVAQMNVKNGQYVEEGQSLLTVSGTRWLTLRAMLPQQLWKTLPCIRDASIRLPGTDSLASLSSLDGSLLSYARQVSSQQPLLPVLFRVRYNTAMLPGSWVEMYVRSETRKQALTVPVESVIEEMGLRFLYVQLTPELFEKREVTTGATDGRRIEVLTGLKFGERVVASGAVLVKLTQVSGGVDPHAGHMH